MSRIRKSFLVAVLLAGAAALPTLGQEREDGMSVPDEHTMIFFAVLEGLYRDGASNEAVDAILRQDDKGGYIHFVYGCPICTPSRVSARSGWDRRGDLPAGGGGIPGVLAQAAADDPVREAQAAGREEDEDRLLHR